MDNLLFISVLDHFVCIHTYVRFAFASAPCHSLSL